MFVHFDVDLKKEEERAPLSLDAMNAMLSVQKNGDSVSPLIELLVSFVAAGDVVTFDAFFTAFVSRRREREQINQFAI